MVVGGGVVGDQQFQCQWLVYVVGYFYYYCMLVMYGVVGVFEQGYYVFGGVWVQVKVVQCEVVYVYCLKIVDVFQWIDVIDQCVFVDVWGQW